MKTNNLKLVLDFLKWYAENRKWQSRLILTSLCLSIVKGDIMIIIKYLIQ
jgi:hypothetical protein